MYTQNIPQLSYLHCLHTPCQMFTNLFHTQSRCVSKTTKHCDTRILPQHHPPPNPTRTALVFLSENCPLAAGPTPSRLLTNHLLLFTLHRHPDSLYQKDFIRLKWCGKISKQNKTNTRQNGIHNPHSI